MQSQRIRSGFNFLAPFYDFVSFLFFGNAILRSQIYFLPQIKKCKKALVFGGGTGKLLIELMKHDLAEQYCYVDISDKMITKSRTRLQKKFPEKANAVSFICGSANEIPADATFDLVITPYVLDCISTESLPLFMQQLHSHLTPGGEWLFVDFNVPEKSGLKKFSQFRIRVMYFFFNTVCRLGIKQLPDFKKEFEKLDYTMANEKYFSKEFRVARVYKKWIVLPENGT